jgi:histidinol-phosphate aminotransferase
MLKPAAAVQSLAQYHPPLADRRGLRLDFNENTAGCSPRVLDRLRRLSPEDLARYPERAPVEAAVAGWLRLSPNELLLTNGVDEAIHLLCETFLEPGTEALMAVPTFSMYEIYAAATGARVRTVQADADFRFPLERIRQSITPSTRLIAVANPNNPTGTVVERESLLALAAAAPAAAVLVDEAYFDFYGATLVGEIARVPNLFIARTFSKAYGMAGLRAGVLAGPESQIAFVQRVASPYNVNAAALACLPEAIADTAYVADYVAAAQRNRARLEAELGALGLRYWKSAANFVLLHIGSSHDPFVRKMRQRGILVRDRDRDPGCAGCVRITVGSDAETEPLFDALRETVSELRAAEAFA